MSVEERVRALGEAVEGLVNTDYSRVVAAYRRRRVARHAAAVGSAAVLTVAAIAVGFHATSGDSAKPPPATVSLRLAITNQIVNTTIQPAGLRGHYVVLNASAAVVAAGNSTSCAGFVRDPVIDGSTLRLQAPPTENQRCQDLPPSTQRWRPMLLTFSANVFDRVHRITVTGSHLARGSYTPTDRSDIHSRGLPSVITGTVTAAGATATRLLAHLDAAKEGIPATTDVASDGTYTLPVTRTPARYRLQAVAPGGPCGTDNVRIAAASAATVDLNCAVPAANSLHGLDQVWPHPSVPRAGEPARIDISGKAAGSGLAPTRLDFGDETTRTWPRQPDCTGHGPPVSGRHTWLTRFQHRWLTPGNYNVTIRLASCDNRVPVHTATFVLRVTADEA